MFGFIEDAARAVGGAISGVVKAVASVITDGSSGVSFSADNTANGTPADASAAPTPENETGNALPDAGNDAQHLGFGIPGANDAYGSLMPESTMSLMESLANGTGFDLALAQNGLIPTTDHDMQQADLSACMLPDTHDPGCIGLTPTDAFADTSMAAPMDYLLTDLHHHAMH